MEDAPQSLDDLHSWIDRELGMLGREADMLRGELVQVERDLAQAAHHPNHDKYTLGGVLAAAAFGPEHIGLVHWWLARPWADALTLLADSGSTEQPAYLLRRLSDAARVDPSLAAAGTEHLREAGVLVERRLPKKWLAERGKFGLGLPLVSAGLRACDRDTFAGLWTLDFDDLAGRFAEMAPCEKENLCDLLRPLLDADRERLSARGQRSNHLRARARYRADCDSFAAFDAQDYLKRWRVLPPSSRQGFLAVATARALLLPQPRFRTRGDAADWLRGHDANLRFNLKENDR